MSPLIKPTKQTAWSLGGVKALVLDDESDCRDLFSQVLVIGGAEVRTAVDGTEALEVLREFHPHVILSDLAMPRMDGYRFVRELRRDPKFVAIPALAVSASGEPTVMDQALAAGFNLFLPKPLMPEELIASITTLLGLGEAAP